MKKRIFSRILALVMAVSLLSTTAFAASFVELQGAIDDTGNKKGTPIGSTGRYGYVAHDDGTYGIEAWDANGTRNVQLNEDVVYTPGTDKVYNKEHPIDGSINISKKLNVDMGGHKIDAGYRVDEHGKVLSKGTQNSVIRITSYGDVTLSNGVITGGNCTEWPTYNVYQYQGGRGGGINCGGKLTMNNVTVTGNTATWGGGIYGGWDYSRPSITMNNVIVTGNTAKSGGGVCLLGGSLTMKEGSIDNNKATWGGGMYIDDHDITNSTWTVTLDSCVTENTAEQSGGGIYVGPNFKVVSDSELILGGQNKIYGNYDQYDSESKKGRSSDITVSNDVYFTVSGLSGTLNVPESYHSDGWYKSGNDGLSEHPITLPENGAGFLKNVNLAAKLKILTATFADPEGENEFDPSVVKYNEQFARPEDPIRDGYTFDGWTLPDGTPYDFTTPATKDVELIAKWTPVDDGDDDNTGDTILDAGIPLGDVPVAGGADTAATTIEEEETPLAGLFTRADAIGYLWEQTGSPEAEISDFPDVPEDHYWAVAIGWAQDMGIALPDEEGNFRPDDLVLLTSDEPEGELQEFLNRYAVFAGIELEDGELFIELEADDDGIIMGEEAQVIFDQFFAKLEAALADQAKQAA